MCESKKLKMYNKYEMFFFEQDSWVNVTPFENHSSKIVLKCLNCGYKKDMERASEFEVRKIPDNIVLDLDHTLISSINEDSISFKGDFSIELSNDYKYEVFKRPHLDEFLLYIRNQFKVIEVITASRKEYAELICKSLGLLDVKITSREDLVLTELDFNRSDYVKVVNNSLVIDDKTYIYEGQDFLILNPKPFINEKNDTDLLKIMDYIEKNK